MNPKALQDIRVIDSIIIGGTRPSFGSGDHIGCTALDLVQAACLLASVSGGEPTSLFVRAFRLLEDANAFLRQQRVDLLRERATAPQPLQRLSIRALEQLGFKQVSLEWILSPIARPRNDGPRKKAVMRIGSITTPEALRRKIFEALPREASSILAQGRLTLPQLKALEEHVARKIAARNRRVAQRGKKQQA